MLQVSFYIAGWTFWKKYFASLKLRSSSRSLAVLNILNPDRIVNHHRGVLQTSDPLDRPIHTYDVRWPVFAPTLSKVKQTSDRDPVCFWENHRNCAVESLLWRSKTFIVHDYWRNNRTYCSDVDSRSQFYECYRSGMPETEVKRTIKL